MICALTEMRFRFESDMLHPLVDYLPEIFHLRKGERARVLVEPTIGSVIPDVIMAIWSGELPRCGTLNSVSRHVLAFLASQRIASGEMELCDELFLSKQAAATAVSSLKKIGVIAQRDSGEVELSPQFDLSGTVKLIALELKMKRWREALEQAKTYRTFADEAYVVLDANQVKVTADIRAEFVANGIGLFLQDRTNLKRRIVPSVSDLLAPSVDRLLAVGKIVNAGPYCVA